MYKNCDIIEQGIYSLLGYYEYNFRRIFLSWLKFNPDIITIIGIIDGDYDDQNEELLMSASTELFTRLEPIDSNVKIIRCDYPTPIKINNLGIDRSKYYLYEVYRRYEE